MTTQTLKKLKLEGVYQLDGDYLTKENLLLKLGTRHRPKKGQAKRFIGSIDKQKPADEQYSYISSLYSVQGEKNTYELEYAGDRYLLQVKGINQVLIEQADHEPVLAYEPEGGSK